MYSPDGSARLDDIDAQTSLRYVSTYIAGRRIHLIEKLMLRSIARQLHA